MDPTPLLVDNTPLLTDTPTNTSNLGSLYMVRCRSSLSVGEPPTASRPHRHHAPPQTAFKGARSVTALVDYSTLRRMLSDWLTSPPGVIVMAEMSPTEKCISTDSLWNWSNFVHVAFWMKNKYYSVLCSFIHECDHPSERIRSFVSVDSVSGMMWNACI